jgi:hypothetical protein
MPDPPTRLIEAAVRPLSDNAEMKHSAIGFLETRITADADQEAMITRWDQVDARKRKPVWQTGLWAVVAMVSTGIAISAFDGISRLTPWGKWIAAGSIFTPTPVDGVQRIANKLSESDKLLLVGDLAKTTKSERKEALWRSDPDNPAYFADYAGAFISDNEKLPPDFLKTARRIDPTNAWFTYQAAAVEAKGAVKKKSRKGKRVEGKWVYETPPSWEILDQTALDRAMDLLREARSQPNYSDYAVDMLRKRLPLLPQRNFIDQLDSSACLAEASGFSSIRLRLLADVLSAKAWSLGEAGDIPGYQELSGASDQFLRQMLHDGPGTLVDQLVGQVLVSTLAENLAMTAEKLGLQNEAARWNPVAKSMRDAKDELESRKFLVDGKPVKPDAVTGGILGGSIAMIAKRPKIQPNLTDADLKPLRLFDHELLSRLSSYVAWAVLGLCACLVASYRFRVPVMSRRLARRMEDLLGPSDWAWIFAVSVVLPFIFVMAINRLTPLGGRAFGLTGMNFLLPAGHFLGLLLLWLALPVQVVRWRLAKRAGGFGFPGSSLIGWLAVACATAFVPMVGWAAISQVGDSWLGAVSQWPWQFWAAAGLAGLATLWVLGSISLAMLGRSERHVYRATSALALVKVYAAAMLVIALASLGFKASERYWFRQDWMTKFDVAGPGWSAFESKVAAQMRKELRETLGYDP